MRIYREKILGPCVLVLKFLTEEEALAISNDTICGLASTIFTINETRAPQLAKGIESGTIWINSSSNSDFRIPFGSVKQGGIDPKLGEAALAQYTTIKAVHLDMGFDL